VPFVGRRAGKCHQRRFLPPRKLTIPPASRLLAPVKHAPAPLSVQQQALVAEPTSSPHLLPENASRQCDGTIPISHRRCMARTNSTGTTSFSASIDRHDDNLCALGPRANMIDPRRRGSAATLAVNRAVIGTGAPLRRPSLPPAPATEDPSRRQVSAPSRIRHDTSTTPLLVPPALPRQHRPARLTSPAVAPVRSSRRFRETAFARAGQRFGFHVDRDIHVTVRLGLAPRDRPEEVAFQHLGPPVQAP
jgi:hypothetical protein